MSDENAEEEERNSSATVAQKNLTTRPTYGVREIVNICIPVCISMVIVVAAIKAVPSYSEAGMSFAYTPFNEDVADTLHRTTNSLLNATSFITVVMVTTVVLILLYYFTLYKTLAVWLMVTTFSVLSLLTLIRLKELFLAYNYPIDVYTTYLFVWNFMVLGMVTLYWKGPTKIQQVYLIYISISMALLFLKHLPEWSGWMVLGVLVIWDLIAVLAPKGPLRFFIETAKERNDVVPPVLIYVSMVSDGSSPKCEIPKDTSGIKLGLGDFIFYCVLVGKAAKSGDWVDIISCMVAILVGLIITVAMLIHYKRVLPALPISIIFGLIVYFVSFIFVKPFSCALVTKQVFI